MTRWPGVSALVVVVGVALGARAVAANVEPAAIEAACPCEATIDGDAWASHDEYVACVASEARRLRLAGGQRPKALRAAVRAAKRSTCGDTALTRCCVYQDFDSDVGRCRMMTPDACDALDDRLFETSDGAADDDGPGSCVPNPCAF